MMLSALPMTAIASVLAGVLGLAGTSAGAGPRLGFVLLLVFLGMIYTFCDISGVSTRAGQKVVFKLRVSSNRSEEHTSELQSLMRISYAVFCLKKKNTHHHTKQLHWQ